MKGDRLGTHARDDSARGGARSAISQTHGGRDSPLTLDGESAGAPSGAPGIFDRIYAFACPFRLKAEATQGSPFRLKATHKLN